MRIRLGAETMPPKRGVSIGAGYSYYEDGTFDIGIVIGKRYYNLELNWSKPS